jgi:hypothetical protein
MAKTDYDQEAWATDPRSVNQSLAARLQSVERTANCLATCALLAGAAAGIALGLIIGRVLWGGG